MAGDVLESAGAHLRLHPHPLLWPSFGSDGASSAGLKNVFDGVEGSECECGESAVNCTLCVFRLPTPRLAGQHTLHRARSNEVDSLLLPLIHAPIVFSRAALQAELDGTADVAYASGWY